MEWEPMKLRSGKTLREPAPSRKRSRGRAFGWRPKKRIRTKEPEWTPPEWGGNNCTFEIKQVLREFVRRKREDPDHFWKVEHLDTVCCLEYLHMVTMEPLLTTGEWVQFHRLVRSGGEYPF